MADPVPKTRFNAPVSAHRTIDALSYDLAELKQIQAAIPGATVNDIALAIAGGALRAYLAEYDELPEPRPGRRGPHLDPPAD
jgi:diacylglycerol O-acyltransferase / wax synthase